MEIGGAILSAASEHVEQREFVRWFRQTHESVLIFAIPNGGSRSRATGAGLKAEGVVRGVPDLFIPAWKLFIEMKKTEGSVVSPWQVTTMAQLRLAGYQCVICRGADDAINFIGHFLKAAETAA